MDFSSVFRTHDFLEDAAVSYGFKKKGGVFTLERALPETDGLAAVVTVHGREMTVSVVELPDRVPYALFEVESAEGAFVYRVRQEAENLVRDVVENCFFDSDVRSRLLSYVKERYGTEQENLRVIYKDYCTLREHGTKKWYGLFMRIPWTSLHVERKGMTEVLNVKADPEEIQRLIDHDRYFPAYHMDKVHWISILLDKETDMDAAKRMLDESYALVEKSGRKGRRKVKK